MCFKSSTSFMLSVFLPGLLVFSSCHMNKPEEIVNIPTETALPGPKTKADEVVLPFDTTNVWLTQSVFPKTFTAASLSGAELKLIDSLMETFVTNYNLTEAPKTWETHKKLYPKDTSGISGFTFDMKNYKKQYITVINTKGEKEVWVNCFCKSIEKTIEFKDWKDYVIRVYDGGSCFFNLKLNLNKKNYYDLYINSGG